LSEEGEEGEIEKVEIANVETGITLLTNCHNRILYVDIVSESQTGVDEEIVHLLSMLLIVEGMTMIFRQI
jgi:hypothetical protein